MSYDHWKKIMTLTKEERTQR